GPAIGVELDDYVFRGMPQELGEGGDHRLRRALGVEAAVEAPSDDPVAAEEAEAAGGCLIGFGRFEADQVSAFAVLFEPLPPGLFGSREQQRPGHGLKLPVQ